MTCQWDSRTQVFLNAVKSAIPSGDRDYNPQTKTWYMKEAYGEAVRGFAQGVFGISSVSFISREATEQAERNRPVQPILFGDTRSLLNEFFGIVGSVVDIKSSYEDVKRAYRQTAVKLHPDRGGDAAKMARLNELWGRIEKEHFRK